MIKSGFLSSDLFWVIEELYNMIVLVDPSSMNGSFIFSYDIQDTVVDLLKSFCALVTVLSANGLF